MVIVVELLQSVLLRIFLRFLRTLVTANRDLFSSDGHFDSAVVDRPITNRTLARVHYLLSPSENDLKPTRVTVPG